MEPDHILSRLLKTGEFTDLVISCGGREFKAHKCIVCLRSSWFRAACQEERWKEGNEGLIELTATDPRAEGEEDYSCDDPEAVGLMIEYMYMSNYGSDDCDARSRKRKCSGPPYENDSYLYWPCLRSPRAFAHARLMGSEYRYGGEAANAKPRSIPLLQPIDVEDASSSPNPPKNTLTIHARMYALGAKYDIPTLKDLAMKKLAIATGPTIREWSRHDMAAAILITFNTTVGDDRGLRDILIGVILNCAASIVEDPIVVNAIKAVDGLGFELFKAQGTKGIQGKSY